MGVEIGERFVEQDELRPGCERPCQRHTLSLSAGQFVRTPVAEAAQPDDLQNLIDPGGTLLCRQPGHLQAEVDIAAHGHVRPQRIGLEHHADPAFFRGTKAVAPATTR